MHKITHNSMKNRGSTLILTILVDLWSGLREEVENVFNEDR